MHIYENHEPTKRMAFVSYEPRKIDQAKFFRLLVEVNIVDIICGQVNEQ